MDELSDATKRERLAEVLDAFVVLGWATGWRRQGDDYDVSWTAKGRERIGWIKTIDRELDPNETAMIWLFAASRILGPDVG